MGWKSTVGIGREHAISLITERLKEATNDEIASALEGMGFGDNVELSYFGHNFRVLNTEEEADQFNSR